MDLSPSDTLSIEVLHSYDSGNTNLGIDGSSDDTYAEFIRVG